MCVHRWDLVPSGVQINGPLLVNQLYGGTSGAHTHKNHSACIVPRYPDNVRCV